MTRYLKAIAVIAGLTAGTSLAPQGTYAASLGPIQDFMTMDVCIGGDGKVVQAIPGDAACKRHRDIQTGETPAYQLGNFGVPAAPCKTGPISKINIPVVKDGNTRIVSSTVRNAGGGCGASDTADADDDNSRNGASIQWHDDGYGFIMGSWSPVSLSAFESSMCADNSQSSKRFFRGWVIAPANVPGSGKSGYGVFPSKLRNGDDAAALGACAVKYSSALTTWAVEPVAYKSGRTLVSIISSHYAQGAPDGKSPGKALQMEQTYWTREFGLSRWEKWAREDWVHPRFKLTAVELAEKLYARGRCSETNLKLVSFNDQLQISPRTDLSDVYARTIANPATGETHTWYMTLCEDYTNAQVGTSTANTAASLSALADDAYWR